MHRKRVTCELHDSYFRLMTIKHAISKILSRRLNYYITRWRQKFSEFGDQTVSWRSDELETRCGRSQHITEWVSGLPVEQRSRRTRTIHGYIWRGWWGQYVAVFIQSLTPSHSKTLCNPFRTLLIKWVVRIFFLKTVSLVVFIVSSLWFCMHM